MWESQYEPHGNVHIWLGGVNDCEDTYSRVEELLGTQATNVLQKFSFAHRKDLFRDGLWYCSEEETSRGRQVEVKPVCSSPAAHVNGSVYRAVRRHGGRNERRHAAWPRPAVGPRPEGQSLAAMYLIWHSRFADDCLQILERAIRDTVSLFGLLGRPLSRAWLNSVGGDSMPIQVPPPASCSGPWTTAWHQIA